MNNNRKNILRSNKIGAHSDLFFFLFLFFTALIFRTYAAFTSIAQIYPDEIFQTVEMAHKAAFGKGFVFWEFTVGARSWFFPGILAGVYKFLDLIGIQDPFYLNMGIKFFLACFHSLAVSVLYLIFRMWFKERITAFIFSLTLAMNFMLSYISARTLSESIAIPFMVFTLYQATLYVEKYRLRNLILTIVFAGIAYMLRFQSSIFSFGIAISFLIVSKKHLKTSLIFGFGYIGMMLLQGLLDKFTWGTFMHSLTTYLDYNILRGVANKHGVFPWHFYFKEMAVRFNPVTYVTASIFAVYVTIQFRLKKKEFLFAFPFLFFLIGHSLIPHKEPRFIFPFYFAVLAFSSAFFAFIYEKYGKKRIVSALTLALIILSAYTVSYNKFKDDWNYSTVYHEFWGHDKGFNKRVTGNIEISMHMGNIKDLKRAYIYGTPKLWSGGYAYFHKNASVTYTTEKKKMTRSLKTARNSGNKGSYFAFRKGHFKYFKNFKPVLKKIGGTDAFDVYKMIPDNKEIKISSTELPRNTKKGSSWNADGNIVMGKKGVKVTFASPISSSKMKIALDSSDKYKIVFYSRKKKLDSIILRSHPKSRGMFIHLINIPSKVTGNTFDMIEIIPVAGDSSYSLGNIKILN